MTNNVERTYILTCLDLFCVCFAAHHLAVCIQQTQQIDTSGVEA